MAAEGISVAVKPLLALLYCEVKEDYDDIDHVLQLKNIGIELPE